jgi:hypothetical protein
VREITVAILRVLDAGERAALATVVRTSGSAGCVYWVYLPGYRALSPQQ